jgi:flagellar biosynthesis GTPase FlhF
MSQITNILSTLSNHKCHKWIFLIFFLFHGLVLVAQGERKHIRQGNQSFEENDYKKAEISYRKGLEKNARSVPGIFNLGDAFYKQNNFQGAIVAFDSVRSMGSEKQRLSETYYNLGNSLLKFAIDTTTTPSEELQELQSKALPASIEAYKNALRNNPGDTAAKYNLAYAQKLLKDQQQCQNQDQQDQDQQDQDQNQDQQDQQEQEQEDQEQQKEKNQEQQEKQNQQQQESQQQQQQQKEISKEDAERMLEALKNDEKNTLEKLKMQKIKGSKTKTEKDW